AFRTGGLSHLRRENREEGTAWRITFKWLHNGENHETVATVGFRRDRPDAGDAPGGGRRAFALESSQPYLIQSDCEYASDTDSRFHEESSAPLHADSKRRRSGRKRRECRSGIRKSGGKVDPTAGSSAETDGQGEQ